MSDLRRGTDTTKVPDDYPAAGDADEDWWSEDEGCLHGVPWDEECLECEGIEIGANSYTTKRR